MSARDLEQRMWAEACEMLDRAERLRRQFFQPSGTAAAPLWEPPVDVYRVPGGLWLVVAMPGADAESITVTIDRGVLTVAARRQLPALPRTAAVQRMEIPHGRFERRLALPPGEIEIGEQHWVDGCLHLGLRTG